MKNQYHSDNNTRFSDSENIEETSFFPAVFSDCWPDSEESKPKNIRKQTVFFASELNKPEINKPDADNEFYDNDPIDFPDEKTARQEMLVNFLGKAESKSLKNNNLGIARFCTKAIRRIFPRHL